MAPSTAEIICELGACGRIVGVSKFCVFPPELKERAQIGGLYDADLEIIISLEPDLLITRGKHDAIERLAEKLHIGVYRDETDSIDGIERTVRELGLLLHQDQKADTVIRSFRDGISGLKAENGGRTRVRVLLTVSRNPDRLANILTAGRDTFLSEMLEIAGAENVFGDVDMRYPEVSVEAIIAKQPQVILELMPESHAGVSEVRLREQWMPYAMIPAVRDNRIHFLTDDNALIPSPRYVHFMAKVGALIHTSGDSK